MGKNKQPELIRGSANHRRTDGNYMGVLLDAVMRQALRWQRERGGRAGAMIQRSTGQQERLVSWPVLDWGSLGQHVRKVHYQAATWGGQLAKCLAQFDCLGCVIHRAGIERVGFRGW